MGVGQQFDISYWSYSKSGIKQSLTVLDPSLEDHATKMCSSILIYSGLEEPGKFFNYLSGLRIFLPHCVSFHRYL